MRIREAIESDAEAIAAAEYETAARQEGLLNAAPHEIPVEAFRSRIRERRQRGLYVVLEDEGALRGHLLLDPMGLKARSHVVTLTVVVHPGHTGRGLGRRLMTHAIEWAQASPEFEKIELTVRSTNARAIRLYESLGFEREGIHRARVKLQNGYADDISMALFVRDEGGGIQFTSVSSTTTGRRLSRG
ncbi:MAG TPA: GNAT family N-acetyltransferase [Gammaproteobacteria bacterium]|nr:GNAT family N-acetyltransferase [Gammaproteobacteria bacterium]